MLYCKSSCVCLRKHDTAFSPEKLGVVEYQVQHHNPYCNIPRGSSVGAAGGWLLCYAELNFEARS
jgi:hypothetical protein